MLHGNDNSKIDLLRFEASLPGGFSDSSCLHAIRTSSLGLAALRENRYVMYDRLLPRYRLLATATYSSVDINDIARERHRIPKADVTFKGNRSPAICSHSDAREARLLPTCRDIELYYCHRSRLAPVTRFCLLFARGVFISKIKILTYDFLLLSFARLRAVMPIYTLWEKIRAKGGCTMLAQSSIWRTNVP